MANEPSVEYQLGFLGMSWTRVEKLKSDLFDRAALMHQMGAVTKAAIISDEAKDSGKRLCFSADDNKYWIEVIPSHHVDWDMNEDEWHELRALLWWSSGPYAKALRAAGKLGQHTPPPPPPVLGGGAGGAGGSAYGAGAIGGAGGAGGGWLSAGGGFPRPDPAIERTGRTPRHPLPQPWPRRDDSPQPVQHKVQKPVDSQENIWRCEGCGQVYFCDHGFAICPNDPNPPTGSKVGGGPVIA